jgi:hypothetical protein
LGGSRGGARKKNKPGGDKEKTEDSGLFEKRIHDGRMNIL